MDGDQAFFNLRGAILLRTGRSSFSALPERQIREMQGGTMRVVAGSEGSKDFRQAELDLHRDMMSRFIDYAREANTPASCTLILRSASSTPAQVLTLMKDALTKTGIQARAILAKLEPERDLQKLYATLSALSPESEATALIRWARNPRLLDAHEQVAYGHDMCWSGDAMRRDADKRNPLALFEANAPGATLHARRAFKALWGASVPAPSHLLDARETAKPSATYEPATDALVTALKAPAQGWPLVRH